MRLEIDEYPPSLNQMRNIHWSKKNNLKRQWAEQTIVQLCNNQENHKDFKDKPVQAKVIFSPRDKRKRDLDNFCTTAHKFIADALQGRVIENDDQIRRITFEWGTEESIIVYEMREM